jgi:hypothetical protein
MAYTERTALIERIERMHEENLKLTIASHRENDQ